MACSKEEIEKKRLAALQKRQMRQCLTPNKSTAVLHRSPCESPRSAAGPIKKTIHNSYQNAHPYANAGISGESQSNVNGNNAFPLAKVVSGTVYLISEERFEVNPSEFCSPLINIFKSMPSKSFGE